MATAARRGIPTVRGCRGSGEKKYFGGVARVNIRVHVRLRDGTSDLR